MLWIPVTCNCTWKYCRGDCSSTCNVSTWCRSIICACWKACAPTNLMKGELTADSQDWQGLTSITTEQAAGERAWVAMSQKDGLFFCHPAHCRLSESSTQPHNMSVARTKAIAHPISFFLSIKASGSNQVVFRKVTFQKHGCQIYSLQCILSICMQP